MRDGGEDDSVCLYDMRYIRFAKEEPCLFRFLFMRPNAFAACIDITININNRKLLRLFRRSICTKQ
ncbi:MAG TPA: hypothetical protein DCY17_00955 [Clostridiales bacterium]|nr:hypothetical protein [Clostridiales bacterium]